MSDAGLRATDVRERHLLADALQRFDGHTRAHDFVLIELMGDFGFERDLYPGMNWRWGALNVDPYWACGHIWTYPPDHPAYKPVEEVIKRTQEWADALGIARELRACWDVGQMSWYGLWRGRKIFMFVVTDETVNPWDPAPDRVREAQLAAWRKLRASASPRIPCPACKENELAAYPAGEHLREIAKRPCTYCSGTITAHTTGCPMPTTWKADK